MNERERIELLMKCYGLTPSQFADRTGIQRASVSHIISGRNKPSLEVMLKIYDAFPGIDMKWLMTGQGEEPVASAVTATANEPAVVENTLFAQVQQPVQQPVQQTVAAPQARVVVEPEQPRVPRQPSAPRQLVERLPKRSPMPRVQQSTGEKRIKEIRIFYTDGTYETMFPEK